MRAVGLDEPLFARRGEGACLEDVDGNRYVDWVMSWGPLLFGHADPETVEAVTRAAADGTSFGAPTEARGRARRRDRRRGAVRRDGAARLVRHRGVDERRSASRAPRRGATGSSSSPAATTATSTPCSRAPARASRRSASRRRRACPRRSPPTRSSARTTTSTRPPRPSPATARDSRASSSSPSRGTWASSRREPGFLEALRALCDASGALLVFDEVITGFRVARGGAQELYGVAARPDHPRQDRRRRAPAGGLRRPRRADGAAGAGRRRLPGRHALGQPARDGRRALRARRLRDPAVYERLERRGARLEAGPRRRRGVGRVQRVGAMLTLFLTEDAGTRLRRRAALRHRPLRRALPAPARPRRLPRAVPVRGDVRLARARRRRDRPHGRRRGRLRVTRSGTRSPTRPSAREPALGARRCCPGRADARAHLLPARRGALRARAGDDLRGLSRSTTERPRLFTPTDHDNALLLGDYLYAHGLVRIASFHEVGAVSDLAELISLCAQVRAGGLDGDGPPGRRARHCSARGRLDAARDALRLGGDAGPLLALACDAAGEDAVDRALAAHRLRVG